MDRKPIQFIDHVDIRFADLDFYGHVNSKHYVDLVFTARLNFMEKKLGRSIAEVASRGFGYFLTKSVVNYKRPINGLQKVLVTSFVREIRDGKTLVVPFTIANEAGKRLFSDGELEFTIVDMQTKRAAQAQPETWDLFFEPAD